MPKLDLSAIPAKTGTTYPEPYAALMVGRWYQRLGQAGGLTQFGVNLVTLDPGARSSLRHWHREEDEFVMVTEGTLVLQTDAGEDLMHPGDCAAFPANVPDGHCLFNRTDAPARFLVVGTRSRREVATYSDVDMMVTVEGGQNVFTHKDGSPWSGPR